MADRFEGYNEGLTSPFRFHYEITPNDDTDLPQVCRAIRADDAGTVVFRVDGDDTEVPYTMAAGEVIVGRVSRVLSTGTSVTRIQGWH